MRETRDRLAVWDWRAWAGEERPEHLAWKPSRGNLRFDGAGMGGNKLSAVETNSGVGLGRYKYPEKQPASAGGGPTTEQQAEPGNRAFTSPMVVGPKRRLLGP